MCEDAGVAFRAAALLEVAAELVRVRIRVRVRVSVKRPTPKPYPDPDPNAIPKQGRHRV